MKNIFFILLLLTIGCLSTKAEITSVGKHEVKSFDEAYETWITSPAREEWDRTVGFPSLSKASFAIVYVNLADSDVKCRYLDTETGRTFKNAILKQDWSRTYDLREFFQEVGELVIRCDASTIDAYRRLIKDGQPVPNSTFGLYKKHPELVEFYVVHAASMDFWAFGATGVVDAKTGEVYL